MWISTARGRNLASDAHNHPMSDETSCLEQAITIAPILLIGKPSRQPGREYTRGRLLALGTGIDTLAGRGIRAGAQNPATTDNADITRVRPAWRLAGSNGRRAEAIDDSHLLFPDSVNQAIGGCRMIVLAELSRPKQTDPSPEEITELCAEIQAG